MWLKSAAYLSVCMSVSRRESLVRSVWVVWLRDCAWLVEWKWRDVGIVFDWLSEKGAREEDASGGLWRESRRKQEREREREQMCALEFLCLCPGRNIFLVRTPGASPLDYCTRGRAYGTWNNIFFFLTLKTFIRRWINVRQRFVNHAIGKLFHEPEIFFSLNPGNVYMTLN